MHVRLGAIRYAHLTPQRAIFTLRVVDEVNNSDGDISYGQVCVMLGKGFASWWPTFEVDGMELFTRLDGCTRSRAVIGAINGQLGGWVQ